jgi:sporulation protein YlmC with PRC-barrel domain
MVAKESNWTNSWGVMMRQQLHVELLLGEKVFALNGLSIGRLEEIRTQINKGHCFVSEFLVGSYAVLERLAAWRIGRALLRVFGAKRKEGYRVRWDQLDLSDPRHLKLLCDVEELLPLREEQYPT